MRIILFLIALTLVNCSQYSKKNINVSSVDYFVSKNSKELNLPFSDASIMNDIIYVSGQVGTIAGTRELIDGGIGNETSQALKNINSILESLGSSSDKIFKCLCMLNEIEDYEKMNEAYVDFFNERKNLPSRSTFGGRIALEGKIEIECWATK
tara:strand:- start:68 stop:526 length:459 start_codon:yes stop_codon:yes gene_type:complete